MTNANFQKWVALPATPVNEKINRRHVSGEKLMSVELTMAKGAVVPLHHHPHEQITHVISGKIEFEAAGDKRVMGPGEVVHVPSNLPHTATAQEATVMIEVFSPPREDFLG